MVGATFSRVCAQLSHIARNERIYTTAHNCGWLFWKKNVHNLGVCLVYSMDLHLIFGDSVQLVVYFMVKVLFFESNGIYIITLFKILNVTVYRLLSL